MPHPTPATSDRIGRDARAVVADGMPTPRHLWHNGAWVSYQPHTAERYAYSTKHANNIADKLQSRGVECYVLPLSYVNT